MAEREGRLDDHKSWRIRRLVRLGTAPLRAVLVAVAVLLGLWMVWVGIPRWTVPPASEAELRDVPAEARWQVRDNRRKLQSDARTTLLQGLGGAAVLAGAATAYRQLRIAREGQVTERFTRAIDQLGNDNVDVRLGGIYALERIANDSPQDRAAIAEVLTAFVRGHAPWPPSRPGQPPEDTPIDKLQPMRLWAPDVQAALTVLGRRKPPIGPPEQLDLATTDLRRADLSHANLQGAILVRARLQWALLFSAQLQDAFLFEAQMQQALLDGAQ